MLSRTAVSSFHYNVHQPSRAAFLQCYEMDISPHATRARSRIHASCSRIDACDLRRVGFTRYLLTSLSRFNCQAQTCSTLTFRRTARTALLSNKTIESSRRRGVHKPADQEQILHLSHENLWSTHSNVMGGTVQLLVWT